MESSTSPSIGLNDATEHLWLQTPSQKRLRSFEGISLIALSTILALSIGGVVTAWTYSFLLHWNWFVVTLASPGICLILFTVAMASCAQGILNIKANRQLYIYPRDLKEDKKNQIIAALDNDSFENLTYIIEKHLDNYRLVFNGLLTQPESEILQTKIQEYNHFTRIAYSIKEKDPLSTVGKPPQKLEEALLKIDAINAWWIGQRRELTYFQKRS